MNQKTDKKVKITKRLYSHWDEWYVACFTCPSCKENHIFSSYKFCPDCGVEVQFTRGALEMAKR